MVNACGVLAPLSGSLDEALLTQRVRAVMVNFQARAGKGEAFMLEAFLLLQFLQVSWLVKVRDSLRVTPV